ncbi:MAG: primosomal protein N' [candidate division WOR-3 bacterium]
MISKVCVFGIEKLLSFKNLISANVGDLVNVKIKNKLARGVVIENVEGDDKNLSEIISKENYSIDEKAIELAKWISNYYECELYNALKLFLPPNSLSTGKDYIKLSKRGLLNYIGQLSELEKKIIELLKDKNYVRLSKFKPKQMLIIQKLIEKGILIKKQKIKKITSSQIQDIINLSYEVKLPKKPNLEQAIVLSKILDGKKYLLFGPTGSGKTSIFVWLTQMVLKENKGVIILVPEISLSPHIARVFYEKFKDLVAIYHSSFTPSQRTYLWNEIKKGNKKIVIGPRSALFLPVQNLGLIIVDEEHESSYKQDEKKPYYNARDVAVVMSSLYNATLILSSATPSLESYYNVLRKKYKLLRLKNRVKGYVYPDIEIIDLKKNNTFLFLPNVLSEIKSTLENNKSVMIFLNRRGYSPILLCQDCGYIFKCFNCSVNLVFHKSSKGNYLECHMCGKKYKVFEKCLNCNSYNLKVIGFGTQRIEEELKNIFSNYEVLRIDRDTIRNRKQLEILNEKIYKNSSKIIIGTQIIAKGFDLRDVKLAIVPNADIGIAVADFRNYERNIQLLIQFIGRIRTGGKVYIQTYEPENKIFDFVKNIDYEGFLNYELEKRKELKFPPFYRLALIEAKSKVEVLAQEKIFQVYEIIKDEDIEILGPAPAPIEKLKNYYRWRIILRDKNYKKIKSVIQKIKHIPGLKIAIDPYDLL